MNRFSLLICLSSVPALLLASPVAAQVTETVGPRALGMAGAFTAVADDSSATWWNPAGLATGPFLDVSLGRAVTDAKGRLPARRDRGAWFTVGTPPFGFSYYRLRFTDIQPFDPTADTAPNREDRLAGVPVRSLAAGQFGATFVQTLYPGVHIGTTLKLIRGDVRESREDGSAAATTLLEVGEDLEETDGEGAFDLDIGVLAVGGPFRIGATLRNVTAPELGMRRMPRQARIGAAYDGERAGVGAFTIAIDVDVVRYDTGTGDRRVVALGAERWFGARRLAIRGGARVETVEGVGAASAGLSYAIRSALFIDGHVVGGAEDADRGWGLGARVSF